MLAEQYREVVLKPTTSAFILEFCITMGLVYAVVSIPRPLSGVSTS